jgi:hypothetical protein
VGNSVIFLLAKCREKAKLKIENFEKKAILEVFSSQK